MATVNRQVKRSVSLILKLLYLFPFCITILKYNLPIFPISLSTSHRTFDKHAIDRGFWIESKRAWYRLEDPEKTRIQDDNGRSQYDIFLQYQALGGLLSNIIYMNSNEIGGVSHIVQTYRDFEPEELHRKLSLTPDDRQSFNTDSPINPYDMDLIRLRSDFLVTELKKFDKEFGENCTFYKGLKRLSAEKKKAKRRKGDSQYDYLKSALLSEIRSERNAYGGADLGLGWQMGQSLLQTQQFQEGQDNAQ